jgi:parallel beta-helix repeat protein
MSRNIRSVVSPIALCVALIAGIWQPAGAATLCVNPGGTGGCFSKIGNAVSAALTNDTINVASGTYNEDVIIGKALSLIGANPKNTVINASGLPNGIYIDGLDHSGLGNVVVKGFTVENANYEGILVTNASGVTISDNIVAQNDKSLEPSIPACPGQPIFETGEDFDCGEGIHLLGADHSIVADNLVENNGGGILLSDDTGQVHDNLVTGNVSRDNPFD